MSFLRKIFGGSEGEKGPSPAPESGFFVYVRCDRCQAPVRLRIHKDHDLNRTAEGYVWHKAIVDSRCFRPIPTVAYFDGRFRLIRAEMDGGRFITQAEYEAPDTSQPPEQETPEG
jgi:hypothetical protein